MFFWGASFMKSTSIFLFLAAAGRLANADPNGLLSDGFGQLIPTTFGMVRPGSIDDATLTVTTPAPEPACAESFLIGGRMLLLVARRRRRALERTLN
jgi:hypothetical protein